jgi:3-(3-hydroxy-phenyl)propionate hydroxylase
VLATNDPRTEEFGYPRKHGFIQPLVDRELAAGLDRFPGHALRFRHRVVGLEDCGDHVAVTAEQLDDAGQVTGTVTVTGRYVVGCEGGSSFTRKWMEEHHGVEFEGKSPSTRWVVVDVANDPIGTPSVYLGADPRRPYVSIGLPQGIRRWEFMLHDDEPTELVDDPSFLSSLLERHVPDPSALRVINQRTFTHHGRVASTFRAGNVFLAGDAAHLMPVWLGQGWNSGIRDATNLAWKLTAVLDGDADEALLDTYTEERRRHAADMIDVNMAAGSIMKMGRLGGRLRDLSASALNLVPRWKSYFTELRFKPMPRYSAGVVVDQTTLTPGTAEAGFKQSRLAPYVDAAAGVSPVGLQFIQPRVTVSTEAGADTGDVLLDEVTGDWWALATWGTDLTAYLSAADLDLVRRHRIRLVSFMPETQRAWAEKEYAASAAPVTVVGDTTGALKAWFDVRACGLVILRPDRFVAAAALTQQASQALAGVVAAGSLLTEPSTDVTAEGARA